MTNSQGSNPGITALAAANGFTTSWAARLGSDSTVFSGIGVWVLLAALCDGAEGKARTEIEETVGIRSSDCLQAVREVFDALASSQALRRAVGIWVADKVELKASWTDALPPSTVGQLFEDGLDQARLDEWVATQTEGEIDRLPIMISPETLMVLASALSIRTDWISPFEGYSEVIESGPWSGRRAERLTQVTSNFDQLCISDATAGAITSLRWPGKEDIDVYLFLGEPTRAGGQVLAAGLGGLDQWRPALDLPIGEAGPGVTVSMVDTPNPKDSIAVRTVAFNASGSHDLLANAADFGLATAQVRTDQGHFPGMSDFPLAIEAGRQNAVAKFSALGFRASAVTAFGFRAAGMFTLHRTKQVDVVFDRPFGFAAIHRTSRLVLVAGWVAEPAQVAEE